jgi:hypothetical protein
LAAKACLASIGPGSAPECETKERGWVGVLEEDHDVEAGTRRVQPFCDLARPQHARAHGALDLCDALAVEPICLGSRHLPVVTGRLLFESKKVEHDERFVRSPPHGQESHRRWIDTEPLVTHIRNYTNGPWGRISGNMGGYRGRICGVMGGWYQFGGLPTRRKCP